MHAKPSSIIAQVDGSGTEGRAPVTSNTGVAASAPIEVQPKPKLATPPTGGFGARRQQIEESRDPDSPLDYAIWKPPPPMDNGAGIK